MAIYRSDQAQLTFGAEASAGGYAELAQADIAISGGDTLLNGAVEPGDIQITVDSVSSFEVGDHIIIDRADGAATVQGKEKEMRRIEHISGTVITLNAPLAFHHADDSTVDEISATSVSSSATRQFIKSIPGVYETVDLPDPEMSIEPQYFLGTASKRDFYTVYSGQQSLTGSIGSFVLLNGRALRFPIGQVSSSTTYVHDNAAARLTYATALKKGQVVVSFGSSTPAVATTTKLVFGYGSSTCEVRQAVTTLNASTAGPVTLDYPLQFDHPAGTALCVTNAGGSSTLNTGATVPYTHTITETVDLDSVSWHAHMRASDEDSTKDFDRRYFGGKVGSASISAEEGGMVSMSWDCVHFLGMIHNQKNTQNPAGSSISVPFYSLMESIDSSSVDFPTTDPYYFSNGEITLYGQTIARIRSFSLSISNGEEPRYYISKRMGNRRGPTEIIEGRREYGLSVTLALPDAVASTTAQRTLFNELLREGDYGSGKQGFNVTITFTRGNVVSAPTTFEDEITIQIPNGGNASTGGNANGAFLRTAPHNFTTDNPFQVEADILFRNLKITVKDSEHYYP